MSSKSLSDLLMQLQDLIADFEDPADDVESDDLLDDEMPLDDDDLGTEDPMDFDSLMSEDMGDDDELLDDDIMPPKKKP
jgi:hypothetical protein